MALRRNIKRGLRRAVKGGLSRLRKPTPAEIAHSIAEDAEHITGIHRLDPQSWQLPGGLAEAGETETRRLRPGPLVTAIIVLAVIFILIIAAFVAHMPQPPE